MPPAFEELRGRYDRSYDSLHVTMRQAKEIHRTQSKALPRPSTFGLKHDIYLINKFLLILLSVKHLGQV